VQAIAVDAHMDLELPRKRSLFRPRLHLLS
jgi:hypothetical protein